MGPEGHETWRSWVDATLPREQPRPWPSVGRLPQPGEPPEDAGRLLDALLPASPGGQQIG